MQPSTSQSIAFAGFTLVVFVVGLAAGQFLTKDFLTTRWHEELRDEQRATFYSADLACQTHLAKFDASVEAERDAKLGDFSPITVTFTPHDGATKVDAPGACKAPIKPFDPQIAERQSGKRAGNFTGGFDLFSGSGNCFKVQRSYATNYNRRMSQIAPSRVNTFCSEMKAHELAK